MWARVMPGVVPLYSSAPAATSSSSTSRWAILRMTILLQLRGAVAEYDRALIGDRMRRGRLARYRAGLLLPWTRPVYGYLLDPERPRDPQGVRASETQAAVVRQIFAWYLEEGVSLSSIVNRLFAHGVASPAGRARWRHASCCGTRPTPAPSMRPAPTGLRCGARRSRP